MLDPLFGVCSHEGIYNPGKLYFEWSRFKWVFVLPFLACTCIQLLKESRSLEVYKYYNNNCLFPAVRPCYCIWVEQYFCHLVPYKKPLHIYKIHHQVHIMLISVDVCKTSCVIRPRALDRADGVCVFRLPAVSGHTSHTVKQEIFPGIYMMQHIFCQVGKKKSSP